MFRSLTLAVCLLLSIECVEAWEYTRFPQGCHTFSGEVSCANGNQPREGATVELFDRDDFTPDDKAGEAVIVNRVFKVNGCDDEMIGRNSELYFVFKNVCNPDEIKMSGTLREDVYLRYHLRDDEEQAAVFVRLSQPPKN